jgi:predicted ATPase
MTIAQEQGAVSWELRAATSLARLRIAARDNAAAKAILEPAMRRFSEGFDTADFKEALALTNGLS